MGRKHPQPPFTSDHEHEWVHLLTIERRLLWFKVGESTYSKCQKCGLLRHDNDGETFTMDLDYHTEKRRGLKA